ncbi:hypothetical protein PI125_g13518 [Phytophthora idaei]|nr:hypothetical protein PI125_g13518 [Phytophthora idaei]
MRVRAPPSSKCVVGCGPKRTGNIGKSGAAITWRAALVPNGRRARKCRAGVRVNKKAMVYKMKQQARTFATRSNEALEAQWGDATK